MEVPSWFVSGIIALLLGLYVTNSVRGQEHGAGQPQHPDTGIFITEDEDYWRWIVGGLVIAAIGAFVVPRLTPAINEMLRTTSELGIVFLGILGILFLKSVFKKFG
ncbi:hypothetical protein ACFQJC_05325 [Haloferax namakaokahaiae]|uniref:Uncharacterized protein n=1 Tax=Haloferax namakaokahaiae TaxID=1748331 RepID=A0ABD5ZCG2_9EURY